LSGSELGVAGLVLLAGGWLAQPVLAQGDAGTIPADAVEMNRPELQTEEDIVPRTLPEPPEVEVQTEEGTFLSDPDSSPIESQTEEGIFPPRFPQVTEEEAEAEPEETPEDEFPPNPLELTEPDPLLPNPVVERPLSPLELYFLRQALNGLNLEAQAQLAAGNRQQAFQIWYRELRLRRVLGYEEEIPALGRVGEYAWSEGESEAVQLITARLEEIEQDLQQQEPRNFPQLLAIADSYSVLRNYNAAVRLYEQILEQARERGDTAVEESTLISLGDLHLGWFYFAEAAEVYEELLERARQRGDRVREQDILTQLAYAYQQGENYERAIAILQQLVEWYRETDPSRLPPLQLALGNSYRQLEQLVPAANAYQAAYAAALAQQQWGYASDALRQLADLYQALGRPDDALVVYRLLQSVQLESYDRFGIMEVFGSMGQIYQEQGQTGEAIASYRQALQLAEQMDYPGRVRYFQEQLAALGPSPSAPSDLSTTPSNGLIPFDSRDLGDSTDSSPSIFIPVTPAIETPLTLPEGTEAPTTEPSAAEDSVRPLPFEPFGPP